jgi:hypothetical protein
MPCKLPILVIVTAMAGLAVAGCSSAPAESDPQALPIHLTTATALPCSAIGLKVTLTDSSVYLTGGTTGSGVEFATTLTDGQHTYVKQQGTVVWSGRSSLVASVEAYC